MSPHEYASYLESVGLLKAKQDHDVRYKIAVWKCYSKAHYNVYNNWLNRELGLEDLYQDLLAEEAARLNAQTKKTPEQFVPNY